MNSGNILFIHNSTGSRIYRMLPQARYLADHWWDVRVRGTKKGNHGGISQEDIDWADIVVVEMIYSPKFIKKLKDSGCKIVYEIDDLMEVTHKDHYAYSEMNHWRTYQTYKSIMLSDVVTVSVDNLKEHYSKIHDNIHVLPNLIDMKFWDRKYLENTSDTIRLGWIGGTSHKGDLKFIAPVIKRVLEKYKNVKFIAVGYGGTNSSSDWVNFNYGENIFKDLPKSQYEFSLGVPMEVYPDKVASMRLDLAIAPVVDTKFARCKSNCKSLEYGLNRIPAVYADFLYKDSVVDSATGYLASQDPDDWYEKICKLIDRQDKKEMGEDAREHIIKNFNFEDKAEEWMKLYSDLLAINK